MIKRNLDTKESRDFWDALDATIADVPDDVQIPSMGDAWWEDCNLVDVWRAMRKG